MATRRGGALIIVLGFLVLIAVLVIGFLSSVGTETQMSRSYDDGLAVRELVNSATQVALGQLSDATKSLKTPRPPDARGPIPARNRLTWSSQPGAIRTWDDAGRGWKLFKLYSAAEMVVDLDDGYRTAEQLATEVPDTWPALPVLFTDLNEPVLIDDAEGPIETPVGPRRASWPIVDPLALIRSSAAPDLAPIDGFRIERPPGYGAAEAGAEMLVTESDDPTLAPAPGRTGNPAPMPVAWIYMLRDGTLTVPTEAADEGLTATWAGAESAHTPSRDNPIVGRFAFWTDDETCKINLNTASEPTPWDTPRAITIHDLNYGRFQPAQKEYQRFPGHPFTTALSPVFFPGGTLDPAQKRAIYQLIPRVGTGGTSGGTVAASVGGPALLDEERLLANVDEFLFQPTRAENPVIDPQRLRRARFFLTANSRAPEVNLHGQPRVALWPVRTTGATGRTAYDQLAAFCSTIGAERPGIRTLAATAHPFYFQRANPHSPTADYASIERNRQLYEYLQRLTAAPIPGYGGNFLHKWGPDCDQVLTQIFDYVRITNLRDPLLPEAQKFSTPFAAGQPGRGQVAPIEIGETHGFGRIHTVSQVGMHFICSQEADAGILAGNRPPNNKLPANTRLIDAAFLLEPWSPVLGYFRIEENLFFDVQFDPAGFQILNDQGVWTSLKMRSGGKNLNNKIGAGFHMNGREHGGSGGLRGPMQAFGGANYQWVGDARLPTLASARGVVVRGETLNFRGGDVTIRIYTGNTANPAYLVQTLQLKFPDGNFPVPRLVRTGTAAARGGGGTAREFWWTFAGYTPANAPTIAGRYSSLGSVPHMPADEYADPKRRWVASGGPPGFKIGGIFRDEDVVRSIVPDHGDIRLIAAKKNVAASEFVKVRAAEWNSPIDRMLHVFSASAGTHFHYGFANEPGDRPGGINRPNPLGGTLGGIPGAAADDQLVASPLVKYHYSRFPEIRPGAGKRFNHWNDYDNGMSTWMDGAYINKPDEGNLSSTNSPYTYFAWNFTEANANFFSPNRLVPSAGMLGSLPTGVKRNRPWETLLFRPELRFDPSGEPHPGTQSPRDHLLMDLFWMPVIEPYAISEPFSTAGKVNLNYEIAPFSYIRRTTALHAAMKAEEPLILPNEASKIYKLWDHETNDHPHKLPSDPANAVQDADVKRDWTLAFTGSRSAGSRGVAFDRMRRPIDVEKTLAQADERFRAGEAFRSASEICELHLVRDGETLDDYREDKIWPKALITGDNTRERPYANLYARLTTRSNSFTVHIRAQILRKAASTDDAEWTVWRENRDRRMAEYRGSALVERYIDPADPNLPDFATAADAVVDNAYKFRILTAKKFVP